MSIENSRPAFPTIKWERDEDGNLYPNESEGMTLRDHFAGLAMQGLFAEGPCVVMKNIAADAYNMADAMLKAREKA